MKLGSTELLESGYRNDDRNRGLKMVVLCLRSGTPHIILDLPMPSPPYMKYFDGTVIAP